METSLFLFPLPPLEPPPERAVVVALLAEAGLLGAPLEGDRYQAGSGFFRYITFAGCSPRLVLEPPAEGGWAFTHLRLRQEAPPRLRITPRRSRPRCPGCGAPVADWKTAFQSWRRDATQVVTCAACGGEHAVAELDWRRYGVAARLLVEVTRVWPGEAVPDEGLLQRLEAGTGRPWGHAWAAAE